MLESIRSEFLIFKVLETEMQKIRDLSGLTPSLWQLKIQTQSQQHYSQ